MGRAPSNGHRSEVPGHSSASCGQLTHMRSSEDRTVRSAGRVPTSPASGFSLQHEGGAGVCVWVGGQLHAVS
jgi:hypothetical protein